MAKTSLIKNTVNFIVTPPTVTTKAISQLIVEIDEFGVAIVNGVEIGSKVF
jgi:hypothetical protein